MSGRMFHIVAAVVFGVAALLVLFDAGLSTNEYIALVSAGLCAHAIGHVT